MNYDFTGFDEKRPEDVEDISKNYEGYSSIDLEDFYYETMSSNKKTRKKLKKISKSVSKKIQKQDKTISSLQDKIHSLQKKVDKIERTSYNKNLSALINCDDVSERKRLVNELMKRED